MAYRAAAESEVVMPSILRPRTPWQTLHLTSKQAEDSAVMHLRRGPFCSKMGTACPLALRHMYAILPQNLADSRAVISYPSLCLECQDWKIGPQAELCL